MKQNRITGIGQMIKKGMVVADIGCDHAFLPVYLVENNISDKVYAADIASGPLEAAKKNIISHGLEDKITVIQSDGFENIPDDASVAVIAGMGFHTVEKILNDASDKLSNFKQIIIAVNRNVKEMREYISDHHYTIQNEEIIFDRGFVYFVIDMNTDEHEEYNELQKQCGPILLEKKEEDYKEYIDYRLTQLDEYIEKAKCDKDHPLIHEKKLWLEAKEITFTS